MSMKHWLDCVRTVPSCEEVAELVDMASADFRSEVDGVRLLVRTYNFLDNFVFFYPD